MPCLFIIRGANLDLDQALSLVSFTPYATHRKGDPMKRKPHQPHDDSGFKVDVSESAWDDLPQQCREAEEFLRRHFEELRAIEGADRLALDFAYDCRIGTGEGGKEIMVQWDCLPASLVKVCGELSVEIVLTQFASRQDGP